MGGGVKHAETDRWPWPLMWPWRLVSACTHSSTPIQGRDIINLSPEFYFGHNSACFWSQNDKGRLRLHFLGSSADFFADSCPGLSEIGKSCFRRCVRFLPRDAMRKRGLAVDSCLSVCLSGCLSRWCIVSRWLKISSNFFFGPVAPRF